MSGHHPWPPRFKRQNKRPPLLCRWFGHKERQLDPEERLQLIRAGRFPEDTISIFRCIRWRCTNMAYIRRSVLRHARPLDLGPLGPRLVPSRPSVIPPQEPGQLYFPGAYRPPYVPQPERDLEPPFTPGGGSFGGAGASASWEDDSKRQPIGGAGFETSTAYDSSSGSSSSDSSSSSSSSDSGSSGGSDSSSGSSGGGDP